MTACLLNAQESTLRGGTFYGRVDVEIVNVDVFVSDKQGKPVRSLTREDFQLYIDGQLTTIKHFSRSGFDGAEPGSKEGIAASADENPNDPSAQERLNLVVFVDTANIHDRNRESAINSIRELIDTALSPADAVAVLSLDQSLHMHCDLGSDRSALEAALDELDQPAAKKTFNQLEWQRLLADVMRPVNCQGGKNQSCITMERSKKAQLLGEIRAYSQTAYNLNLARINILEMLVKSLAGVSGRKALIYVSDGIASKPGEMLYGIWNTRFGTIDRDFGYTYEGLIGEFELVPRLEEVAHEANTSRVTFYAIDAESNHNRGAFSAASEAGVPPVAQGALMIREMSIRQPLERTANLTGGIRVQAPIGERLQGIADDLRASYSLGFSWDSAASPGSHKIKVKLEREGLKARHRKSFESQTADERAIDAVVAAVLYNVVDNRLDVTLESSDRQNLGDGRARLPVTIEVPVRNLVFLPNEQIHEARLSFFVSIKNEKGNPRPVEKIEARLEIPSDRIDGAQSDTAVYQFAVPVEPDDQLLIVGVRDDVSAVVATAKIDL